MIAFHFAFRCVLWNMRLESAEALLAGLPLFEGCRLRYPNLGTNVGSWLEIGAVTEAIYANLRE